MEEKIPLKRIAILLKNKKIKLFKTNPSFNIDEFKKVIQKKIEIIEKPYSYDLKNGLKEI